MRKPTAIVCIAALFAPFVHTTPPRDATAATEAEYRSQAVEVGTLPGTVAVDQMGGASYQLPFEVPRGPGGHTPSLGLAYHNAVGNGLLGVGWTVSGLSAIEPCPRDARVTGEHRAFHWFQDGGVAYCLDGSLLYRVAEPTPLIEPPLDPYLVPFGDHEYHEYRTRTNPRLRILYNTSNRVWLVQHPNGRYGLYLSTDLGDGIYSGRGPWLLSRDVDAYGNVISYGYGEASANYTYDDEATDLPGGRPRIEWIAYGATAIFFRYLERPDPVRGFREGVGVSLSSLLAQVDVLYDDTLVRAYKLFYDQSTATRRSRLRSVRMCYGQQSSLPHEWATLLGEVCVPPTSFEYTDKELGFEDVVHPSLPAPSAYYEQPVRVADFNGDGRDDVAIVTGLEDKLRIQVAFGGAAGLGNAKPSVSSSGNLYGSDDGQGFLTTCDPDGDGRDDLVMQTAPDRFTVLGGHAYLAGSTYYWNAFAVENADEGDVIRFAACNDFDGNGYDDVVTCEGSSEDDQYYVTYASDGFELARHKTNLLCRTIGKQIVDITDDGVPDIVDLGFHYECSGSVESESADACLSSGFADNVPAYILECAQSMLPCPCAYDYHAHEAATFECPDGPVCPVGHVGYDQAGFEVPNCEFSADGYSGVTLTAGGTMGGAFHYIQHGFSGGTLDENNKWEYTNTALGAVDINGDGLVDPLFYWRTDDEGELHVQFGTGRGFYEWEWAYLDGFGDFNAENYALADWDSDGDADLIVPQFANGNLMAESWSLEGTTGSGADASLAAFTDTGVPFIGKPNVGDFNGDGMVDILMCDGCTGDETPTSRWNLHYNKQTLVRGGAPMRVPPDYLAHIEDGYGEEELLAYRAFADDDGAQLHCVDEHHCTCPAQTTCRLPRRPVVDRHDVVGVSSETYAYRGALADRVTGRSLGVTEHEVRRDRGASEDWVTLTEYRNAEYAGHLAAFPYAGLPWRTTVWQGAGPETPRHFYTQTVAEHSVIVTADLETSATSAFFVWPRHVRTATYELEQPVSDLSHLSWGDPLTATEYSEDRDEYGNYIGSLTVDDVGQVISTVSYDHDVTAWLVDRPKQVDVVADSNGDQRGRRVRYVYNGPKPKPAFAIPDEDEPALSYNVAYEYDGRGNVTSVKKSALLLQRQWTTTWDACDGAFPSYSTNPAGHFSAIGWDCAYGVTTHTIDANMTGWTTQIDAFGRVTKRVEEDLFGFGSGTEVTIEYERIAVANEDNPSPMRVRRHTAAGSHDWVETDEHGRPIRIGREIAGQPSLREITYDTLGRTVGRTQPFWAAGAAAPSWITTYDNRDRVVRVTGPDGFALDYDYDRLTRTRTDADGRVHVVASDGRGRAIRAVNAPKTVDESSVCYQYGGLDQLMRVSLDCEDKEDEVVIRELEWDAGAYRVATVDDEVSGSSETRYNAFGEPDRHTDGAGRTTKYGYNTLGQLESLERFGADGHPESAAEWEFAEAGQPWLGPPGVVIQSKLWATDDLGEGGPGITRDYRWDRYGRPTEQTLTVDGESMSTRWDYDDVGRLDTLEIAAAGGELPSLGIGYGYDTNGDLAGVWRLDDLDAVWLRKGVDAANQTTKDLFGNDVERRMHYDATGRIDLLQSSPQPWPALAWWVPALLQSSDAYAYTKAGELDRHTDHESGQYERYDYDLAGRLDGILTSTLDDSEQSIQTFAYDRYNNFTDKNGAAVIATPGGRVVSAGPRVYEHDDAGNVIAITTAVEPGGGYTGTPDLPVEIKRTGGNRVAYVSTPDQDVAYRHDADDARVATHWGDTDERWLEHGPYTRITRPSAAPKHRYNIALAPGASVVVTREESIGDLTWDGTAGTKPFTETVDYVLTDLRGSPQSITDGDGTQVERRSFGNWGTPRDPDDWAAPATLADFTVPHGFTGMPAKTTAGLVDFGGRWLDSTAGVMLEPDPVVVDPLDPMSQNATMFGPGPLTIDPTGFEEVSLTGESIENPGWLSWGIGFLAIAITGQSPDQLRDIGRWLADAFGNAPQAEFSWTGDAPPTQMSLAGSAWSYVGSVADDYVPDVVQEFAGDARDTVGRFWWNVGSGLHDGLWGFWWSSIYHPTRDTRELIFEGWTEYDSGAYKAAHVVGVAVQFIALLWEAPAERSAEGLVTVYAKGGTAGANLTGRIAMPKSGGVLGPLSATSSNPAIAARVTLPKALHQGSRATHFREANRMIYEKMQSDPTFRDSLSKSLRDFLEKCAGPRGGMCSDAPPGWVWHHDMAPGGMQLIRSRAHWSERWWEWLHPYIDGKNRGGFWNWGGN